ncbi:MAG: YihY/virulence factor BrkB family protein [Pseudomonadota bacterium]
MSGPVWTALRYQVWPFLSGVFRRFTHDQGTVLAGYMAYAAMLAGMPFLIFATAMTGIVIGPSYGEEATRALFDAVPDHVAQTIRPVFEQVMGQRRGDIALLSLLGTIWAASNGVESIRVGLDRAYDIRKPRNWFVRRLIAIGFVIVGFVTFSLLAVLIIFAPLMFVIAEGYMGFQVPNTAGPIRWTAGAAVLILFFWLMHRILPSRNMRGMRVLPGILTSVVIWGIIASALSIYLKYAPSYQITYGTLAGVIVTLLFFYLTGISIIFGGEVNAEVNKHRLESWDDPDATGPDGDADRDANGDANGQGPTLI